MHPPSSIPQASPAARARLSIFRTGWVLLSLYCLIVFLAALPVRYAQLVSPADEIRDGLARLGYAPHYIDQYGTEAAAREAMALVGLSAAGYARLTIALELAVASIFLAVGLLIAWRRWRDPFALFASLFLIAFGVGASSYLLLPLVVGYPAGFYLGGLLTTLAYTLMPPFFFLFPDGRWVPRWGWLPSLLWAFTTFFWNLAPRSPLNPTNWPLGLYGFTLVLIWGSALAAQVYRYRRLSSPVQRQQTKWLVAGFAAVVGLLLLPAMAAWFFFPALATDTLYSLMIPFQVALLGIIPLAIGFSILRYRLWDIDILVRRTLQYTLLTGLLALSYFGGVVILQEIARSLTGSGDSPLVIVMTTLGIAALFNPLHRRVQTFIDRRFYRRKYNAAVALAQFAVTARDEVELERLAAALADLIRGTMQPENLSFWLKKP